MFNRIADSILFHFQSLFTKKGGINRVEMFVQLAFLVGIYAIIFDSMGSRKTTDEYILLAVTFLVFFLLLAVRRVHDHNKKGYILAGPIIMLVFGAIAFVIAKLIEIGEIDTLKSFKEVYEISLSISVIWFLYLLLKQSDNTDNLFGRTRDVLNWKRLPKPIRSESLLSLLGYNRIYTWTEKHNRIFFVALTFSYLVSLIVLFSAGPIGLIVILIVLVSARGLTYITDADNE